MSPDPAGLPGSGKARPSSSGLYAAGIGNSRLTDGAARWDAVLLQRGHMNKEIKRELLRRRFTSIEYMEELCHYHRKSLEVIKESIAWFHGSGLAESAPLQWSRIVIRILGNAHSPCPAR